MKNKYIYIILSVILTFIVAGLVGWAYFVGKQQQLLSKTLDTVYTATNTSGRTFGGVLTGITHTITNTPQNKPLFKPILHQIYTLQTSGFATVGTSTIYFVDRSTGHVFKKDIAEQTATRINQITNPSIYESVFVNNGTSVIQRYLSDNGNILSEYDKSIVANTSSSTKLFLPANISELVPSPDTKKIAFIVKTKEGSVVYTANPDGSNKKEQFRSFLNDWILQWENQSLLITQKASNNINGSAFSINLKNKSLSIAVSSLPGLETLLSPDATKILLSATSKDGQPVLSIMDTHTNKITPLNVIALARKCVWFDDSVHLLCALSTNIPKKEYQDAWYQGVVHFTDSLWNIDLTSGLLTKITSSSDENHTSIDMIHLSLTPDESTLLFKNKTDQTLWSTTLIQQQKQSKENTI